LPEGKAAKNRLHLDLDPADRRQQEEVDRLLGLGASVVSDRRPEYGWVILADPEGNEFCLELSHEEITELKEREKAEVAAKAAAESLPG
jgi:Glyoxalase-like domain